MTSQKGFAHIIGLILGTLIIVLVLFKVVSLPTKQIADTSDSTPTETPIPSPTSIPAPIVLDNLQPNDLLKSPATISGSVQSGWMFEGSFIVTLADDTHKTITTATVKEKTPGSWTKEGMIPFQADLKFTTKAKTGFLVFSADNPSGLPENSKSYEIPVLFQRSAISDSWKIYNNKDLNFQFKYPQYWIQDTAPNDYVVANFNVGGPDKNFGAPLSLQVATSIEDKKYFWYLVPDTNVTGVKKTAVNIQAVSKKLTIEKYTAPYVENETYIAYVYQTPDKDAFLVFTYTHDGCLVSETASACKLANATNDQKNLDTIQAVLSTFTQNPIPNSSDPTLNYSCPTSEWVNCMPGPDQPKNPQCSPDFLKWAQEECPNFKGAAL